MNYLTYPTAVMKITQNHLDGNHRGNSQGSPHDFPFDEACGDTGRSWFLCPCDEMKVKRIYTAGTNTLWLESTSPVVMPCGVAERITIMVMHPNDDDMLRLKNGQIFKRGEKIVREGTDGIATGNHLHIAVGEGTITGNGWASNGAAWVLTTTGKKLTAEQAFYLDGTTIIKNGGYSFTEKPKPPKEQPKESNTMDNKPDKYAKVAVDKAIEKGILKGDDSGNLKLHDAVTRQDLLVILERAGVL